ncbi:MAG: hypothetical protein QXU98_04160 [Candidatus Parvarchaeota archaeon]
MYVESRRNRAKLFKKEFYQKNAIPKTNPLEKVLNDMPEHEATEHEATEHETTKHEATEQTPFVIKTNNTKRTDSEIAHERYERFKANHLDNLNISRLKMRVKRYNLQYNIDYKKLYELTKEYKKANNITRIGPKDLSKIIYEHKAELTIQQDKDKIAV